MIWEPHVLALAIPAVLIAGVSKGGFGSGASFAGATLLALVLEPAVALGIMLPLLMVIDLTTLRPFWGKWSWRDAQLLVIGSVPGIALGALLLGWANDDVLRILIGTVALLFVAYQLAAGRGWIPRRTEPFSNGVGLAAGAVSGFTSFVSHAGGPPVAIYLLAQGIKKTAYQATTVLVFWIINLLKFGPYLALGAFGGGTWHAVLVLTPFAILGAWIGIKAHHMVPEGPFFRLAYILLTATGAKLIWDALT